MVAPFVPVSKTVQAYKKVWYPGPYGGSFEDVIVFEKFYKGVSQKPPFSNTEVWWSITKRLYGPIGIHHPSGFNELDNNPLGDKVTNAARAKFVGKLGEASQLGSTMTAERRSSSKTVAEGLTSLVLAANAVRKGRLDQAAKHLGFSPPTKVVRFRTKNSKEFGFESDARFDNFTSDVTVGRKMKKTRKGPSQRTVRREVWVMPSGKYVTKSLGNKWLWYSYGVKPLVSDIYNAMDVFTRPIPSMRIRGSAKDSQVFASSGTNWWGGKWNYSTALKYSVSVSADVRVKNSDIWLANQLGLINPVQMFVEGIPFSFMIDWFSNLSDWIGSMTDLYGLEVTDPVTSSKYDSVYTNYLQVSWDNIQYPASNQHTSYRRALYVPSVRLRFAYERFHWQRGLNAISLLVQGLTARR